MTDSNEDRKRELLRRLLQERLAKQQDRTIAKVEREALPPVSPALRDGDLELSFGQEMVWLLEQMVPEAMFYNVVERYGIRGPLDIGVLRDCINEVIKRHETLRTVYPSVGGRPVQRIKSPVQCELPFFDLLRIPEARRDEEARRIIVAEVKTQFDIAVGPLLRPLLLKVGDGDYILALIVHHIAIDGWSLRLFMHEIAAIYSAFLKGTTPDLPNVPVQYADYAQWERRWLDDDRLGTLRDYWRQALGDNPPSLDLPTDHPVPARRTFDSNAYQAVIPGDVVDRLRAIARDAGATFFTVLLSGFATLLMRYTGREDFVIGSVITRRPRPEVENLLGFFINSLALRTNLQGNPTFGELVARTREMVFAAHEHGAYPFQRLVEVMRPKRSVNSNPFAQVFLNMLNLWDRQEVSSPNLSIRPLGGLDLHMPVDVFTLFAAEHERQLSLTFVYSTELFKTSTIERMAMDLRLLLEGAATSPDTRLWHLPISAEPTEVAKDEVREILTELGGLGVRLSVEEGRLKVNAPKGALNDNLKAGISAHREEIINRLGALGSTSSGSRALRHIPRSAPLPLTAAQKRFWFLDKIGRGRSVPNVSFQLRLEGPMELHVMTVAIASILRRHEGLRLRIGEKDGEPYPEISAVPEDLVAVIDLTALPIEESEREGEKLSKRLDQETFNLTTGPLTKVLLVRVSPTVNLMAWCMHHIVSDGWSSSILLRELEAVYSSISRGTAPKLPPLQFQYVDYAGWEAAQVPAKLFERQLTYWKDRLAGAVPLLDLPTDRPRPAQRSFRGGRVDCVIEKDIVARLTQYGKKREATLFMTVLAAFAVVLHRLSGQKDIVIGTPAANRGSQELERIVGPFVNNLSLRLSAEGFPSFSSYLSQVRQAAIEAIDNRDVPFDMVVEAINPERTLDHAPIFQVMFGLHNFPARPPRFEGLKCSFASADTHIARLDLQLDMLVHEGKLYGGYEYASDLFDRMTIERMHELLVEVLNSVLADDGKPIHDLPMRPAAQDPILLNAWNETRVEHDRLATVHGLFEQTVWRRPEATALIIGTESYSYRDIGHAANRLARLLATRGVRRGDRVGVCVDRSVAMPVAVVAVLMAGAAYVPLDPSHPPDRLMYMVGDAKVACVVTLSSLTALFNAAGAPLVLLDRGDTKADGDEAQAPPVDATPDDVAYVIYTSGSTGRPKGVQIEHRNVVSFLEAMRREPGLKASDVLLAVTTLSFDIAGLEIWLPLSVGAKIVLASEEDVVNGARLAELIDRYGVTVMQATPSTWRLLLDSGWPGKPDLKALCGGEAMSRDLAAALLGKVGQLWNMYGPTETTIWSTTSRILRAAITPVIGRPIANTRVYVLEPSGTLAAIGGFGELAIGGEGVARGYWNRAELTRKKFVDLALPGGGTDRVFRTGDIVRFRNDGQLEFHGRRDGQIKLRGYRIELGEIETVLARCAGVKQASVIVREDEPGDQRLVAYVVPRAGEVFEPEAARGVIKAALPAYMTPGDFVVLASMPVTPNGKVNRLGLPAPGRRAELSSPADWESVVNPAQKKVAALWAEILRTNRFSLHDNFFDVGGHSMLVVKLHAALKREFECDLSLTDLFRHTTVEAQAARVSLGADGSGVLHRAEARARKQLHG